jgi:formate dehydrogenase accessory protein FdhD
MKRIMEESLLRWTWNGKQQEPFLCSKGDSEALLRGFLATMGGVDIARIQRVARDGEIWQVETEGGPDLRAGLEERLERTAPVSSDFRIGTEELEKLYSLTKKWDPRFAGQHTVVISDGAKTVTGRDVERQNALDKAVGRALQTGMDLGRSALATSGRISLKMFAKAAAAGIPVLATRKSVGSLSITYGEKLGITVCRFGEEPEYYGAAWRIG